MSQHQRVLVTGVGVVTAVGIGRSAFWRALTSGATGIRVLNGSEPSATRCVAAVPPFFSRHFITDERLLRVCTRSTELLMVAARLAWDDADLDVRPPCGLIGTAVGAGTLDSTPEDVAAACRRARTRNGVDWSRIRGKYGLHPLRRLRHLPNTGAAAISIAYGARGPSLSLLSGLTSGMQAILEGAGMIRDARADVVICGGSDARLEPTELTRSGLGLHLSSSLDPDSACVPFNEPSTGVTLGEGAGVLVLECEDAARQRGARPYAQVLGGAHHVSTSDEPLSSVLERISVFFPQPDAVFAHGDGSAMDDIEARAMDGSRFLARAKWVTSIKGATGHSLCAAGPINAAAALLSIHAGVVPPIRNLSSPGSALPFVTGAARVCQAATVLATALDPRGGAASIVLGQPSC